MRFLLTGGMNVHYDPEPWCSWSIGVALGRFDDVGGFDWRISFAFDRRGDRDRPTAPLAALKCRGRLVELQCGTQTLANHKQVPS